ncbi:hypothetical protein Isop_2325 [Isosphaera pallida ATCC 43644]|uniref:Uncharacterized protein n=1 Tax=Isosphaera pallida (strain ATCC 43644 / DSM 9630 / IS1B) TaxID=575540 RepID=E8R6J2_ISOPI|nr:hypothetical protein Isop_2325 [Isosphaera pallida ATCC 43644]
MVRLADAHELARAWFAAIQTKTATSAAGTAGEVAGEIGIPQPSVSASVWQGQSNGSGDENQRAMPGGIGVERAGTTWIEFGEDWGYSWRSASMGSIAAARTAG